MSDTTKPPATAQEKDLMTEASIKVGKAIARTTVKAETSTRKVKKMAEDLIESVSTKATRKKEAPAPPAQATSRKGVNPLSPAPGLSVEGHLGFLAGDIYQHLEAEGQTPVSRLLASLMKRQHSEAMVYAAIGWLAREGRVTFTPDGKDLMLR